MAVHTADFGQPLPGRSSSFKFKLKEKGDTARFQIIRKPAIEVKHFEQMEDGSWNVEDCPRLDGDKCEKCETYFEIKAMIDKFKKAEGVDDNHPEVKRMDADAYKVSPSQLIYFPILDRNTGTFRILQTTPGVWNKLNTEAENGIDVYKYEWTVTNTGKGGGAKYAVSRVDSSEVEELTPGEKMEIEKGLKFDMDQVGYTPKEEE